MPGELPDGWRWWERRVNVDPELWHRNPQGLEKYTKASASSIAYNLVRLVSEPKAGFPMTGLLGYFVGVVPDQDIIQTERRLGERVARSLDRAKHPLRGQIRRALEGTAYTSDAITWWDSQLGALLAQARMVGDRYDAKKAGENSRYRIDTYSKLHELPPHLRGVQTFAGQGVTEVRYPILDTAVEAPPISASQIDEVDLILREIGKFGLAFFRAIADAKYGSPHPDWGHLFR